MSGLNKIGTTGIMGSSSYDSNMTALELAGVKCNGLGVISGLVLSAGTGLTLSISSGYLCGRKVQLINASSHTCPGSATSYVWMDDDGGVTFSVSPDHPGGSSVCLGKVVTGSSSITTVASDNRMSVLSWSDPYTLQIGGLLTIDVKSQIIKALSIKGNGAPLQAGYANITGSKTDADYTLLAAEYECPIIRFGWTGWTAGRNVIVPSVSAEYTIVNDTGQTATVKASSGTGVAIANGKSAKVFYDGANVRRLTLDA